MSTVRRREELLQMSTVRRREQLLQIHLAESARDGQSATTEPASVRRLRTNAPRQLGIEAIVECSVVARGFAQSVARYALVVSPQPVALQPCASLHGLRTCGIKIRD